MAMFPPLTNKYTNFIKPRKLRDDEKPLHLTIEHGRRQFKVTLKLAENENGDRISQRHLAEKVYCETGIIPKEQKYYYKNFTWENPEMGPWSPALRDMGIRSGDKIQLVSFHQYPDWEEVKKLDSTEKDFAQIRKDLSQTFYNVQRVHQCFLEKGNDIAALTYLRQDFENIKAKFMENIRFLNSLNFDQRNTLGQARRRELVDYAQRQIDKCTDMSTLIFHKLAQSHYISNVGKIFPRDLRVQPSRNMWLK